MPAKSKATEGLGKASLEVPQEDSDHATTGGSAKPLPPALFRVQGPMSTFGGPRDLGMSPTEGLALFSPEDLQDPRYKDLFLSAQPPGTSGLGRRLNPEKYYLACRWNYGTTSRSLLRNTVAIVQSVRTGKAEQARPADWGPNRKTGRVADLSPGLAAALDLDTDDEVIVIVRGSKSDFITPVAAKVFASTTVTMEPAVMTTQQWKASPPRVDHFPEQLAAGIVVHNTEGPNGTPLEGDAEIRAAVKMARRIQRSHMVTDHNWPDTGQHFTISRGGLILEGRHGSLEAARSGKVVRGTHAVSSDGSANRRWFGIEVEGDNRQKDLVTDQQYSALVELCAWLMKWRGVATLPIKGHMDVLAEHTDCPGLFENRLPKLRNDVAKRREQLG